MNNDQFRKLLLTKSSKSGSQNDGVASSPRASSGTPAALGSRAKSSIPMTPRAVAGRPDFLKQLAERDQANKPKQQNKFRTAVPKGSKLAQGYVDRTQAREVEEDDERAVKLKELDEALKNDEIDEETHARRREEIAGGDLESTHLVKGLDFKLLKRVRQGENLFEAPLEGKQDTEEATEPSPEPDVDEELERLAAADVKVVEKQKVQKKGQFAATNLNPGQKRSRNQILAELRAAREAAKAKEESSLGSRFKKIGAKKTPGTRIERDSKGREVMIIVDEDGHERRKFRKVDHRAEQKLEREKQAFVPDKNAEVLGMEVPEFYQQQLRAEQLLEESKEFKMFDDADSDYDPLAELEGASDDDGQDSGSEDGEATEAKAKAKGKDKNTDNATGDAAQPKTSAPARPNYFKDAKTALTSEATYKMPSLEDPSFLAGLRKAKALDAQEKSEEEQKAAEREARLKKLLENTRRDDEDLDMGFGTNRLEDEADMEEGTGPKLSTWGGKDDGGDKEGGGDKPKRKRGAKKRKGDKDSFADVMSAMQRQKE